MRAAEIGHALLDLLIHCAQNPLAGASPVTPSSPSPHLVSARAHAAAQAQAGACSRLSPVAR
jgi:CTD kinase subunit beta